MNAFLKLNGISALWQESAEKKLTRREAKNDVP
ncbi:hypothetical protein ABH899_000270 [Paenibacillus sp. RC84]